MSDISDEIVRAAARAIHRYDMEHALSTWPVPNDHHRAEALAAVTAVYPLLRAQIAAEVRAEVARSLSAPALHALRSIPDGEIRHGCVVMDGAQVRERFRQAYLAIENTEATDGQ